MKTFYRILFLFILGVQTNVFAQMEKAQTAFVNSPYVFNGVVVGFDFVKAKSGDYFMSYKIKVKQRLKGDSYLPVGETVEIIIPLPERYQVFEDGSYGKNETEKMPSPYFKGWSMGVHTQGVFGLKKSTLSITDNATLASFEPSTSPKENSFFAVVPYLVRYDNIEHVNVCTYTIKGFGMKFSNFVEFNAFLATMNLPAVSDVHPYEKKSAATIKQDSLNAVQYAKRVANAKKRDSILLWRRQQMQMQQKSGNHPKALEEVKFEIVNQQVTGTSQQYFEFDINVSGSTSNTYFDNAAFVLEFNTFVFGIDLSANSLISITAGNDFNNSTYIDPMMSLVDKNSYSVRFGIGVDFNSTAWNRVPITSTPNVLLHVKMQLSVCQGSPNLNFADIANVSGADWYYLNPTEDPQSVSPLQYDYADYVYPSNYQLCPPPAIDNFYPQTISAGTKSILTITGHGFGNAQGASQVRFMDANSANTTIQFLDSYDYLSWSDTEIKIKLPYFVDSLTENFYPGSGIFSIKKGDGTILPSPYPININYAVMNYYQGVYSQPTYEKIPFRHVDFTATQNGHAREFVLDTSITNNPQMTAIVFKALKTWTCVTGINWVVTDTVQNAGTNTDEISTIYITETDIVQNKSKVAETSWGSEQFCMDQITHEHFLFYKETDIAIARYIDSSAQTPVNWLFDTTFAQDMNPGQADFYGVLLHELGHAHWLGHIRDASDIMYYKITPSTASAASRLRLYNSTGSIIGGQHVMGKDTTLHSANCSGTVGTVGVQYASYCGSLGIFPYQKKNGKTDISVYPNPFEQSFSVNFNLSNPTAVAYRVVDLSGRTVYQKAPQTLQEGQHTEKIQLRNCAQGFYILSVQTGNKINTYSIIKQE